MRGAIFITVRADSSCLPNKVLLTILNRPTLELIIIRAKLAQGFDEIIISTTARKNNDQIITIAENLGVKYYRGDLNDKSARWLGAAKEFNIDYFVTMDGDDLFCDPELMRSGSAQLIEKDLDFIKAPFGLVCGGFTYTIRTSALEKVCQIKDTDDTEMMWVYFENINLFKVAELTVTDSIYFTDSVRLTLDYQEDFDFFSKVFKELNCIDNDISLREIMGFLKMNPQITAMNYMRQKDYLENQKRKTKLFIKPQNQ
jgi:spore coat polysaccharide biosynthesis protein SpsF